jgi:uncharacterized protein DUF2877
LNSTVQTTSMLTLIECGRFTHEALSTGRGEICAVFRRSVYLRFAGERYACLGDDTLGRGPLNAVVAERRALRSLRLGARVDILSRNVALWSPPRHAARWPGNAALAENLRSLERAAADRTEREGLGGALFGGESTLLRHARPALRALDRWLDSVGVPVPPAVHELLGLGPGLTPSGDDYLAGALVTLRAVGREAAADRLWLSLRAAADRRTHAISRAHLAAAAAGEAHEALHLCLEQLLGAGNAQWDTPLTRLNGVGHCSGWDGFAGAVAVARGALR